MLFSTSCFTTINGVFSEQSPMAISTKRMEKLTCLHLYFHDTLDGTNPTAIRIAGPSKWSFGTTMMIDDPLTKLVGRAQGIYAFASQRDSGLLVMVLNFAFLEGTYNGSALSILGRNPTFDKVREMPIVGGTGVFRYAWGYDLAKTFSFNQKTGDAVVEYNVSVLHF
ncbi:dirigent protein 22-like [Quercus lobata]|uniref:Dirigent protein n=1 Tax=Quercus lobata TaxID=97700 RepID=A0A7N2R2G6_QUELO|nr:dirigent protein 22-like [Quercus lobata]